MTATGPYHFRAALLDDLGLLRGWQSIPHVSRWWGAGDPFDEAELADHRVSRWIVSLGSRPFAYMQDYSVHGWGQHHFDYLPEGSRGIDQYIGEPDMMDQGHGQSFIHQRVTGLFKQGAPAIGTDPHPDNARAIAVYEKLGFEIAGPPLETEWGFVLPMIARVSDQ
ncbi:MAG: GNAT family N-acetyltransferase [Beijerinckiaceae bacterium]